MSSQDQARAIGWFAPANNRFVAVVAVAVVGCGGVVVWVTLAAAVWQDALRQPKWTLLTGAIGGLFLQVVLQPLKKPG